MDPVLNLGVLQRQLVKDSIVHHPLQLIVFCWIDNYVSTLKEMDLFEVGITSAKVVDAALNQRLYIKLKKKLNSFPFHCLKPLDNHEEGRW